MHKNRSAIEKMYIPCDNFLIEDFTNEENSDTLHEALLF
jgi:hypothetical protein